MWTRFHEQTLFDLTNSAKTKERIQRHDCPSGRGLQALCNGLYAELRGFRVTANTSMMHKQSRSTSKCLVRFVPEAVRESDPPSRAMYSRCTAVISQMVSMSNNDVIEGN